MLIGKVRTVHQSLHLYTRLVSATYGLYLSLDTVKLSSLVDSIFTFNLATWYGNLSLENRAQLTQVVNTASKIVGSK